MSLVKTGEDAKLLKKVQLNVASTVDPNAKALLVARELVRQSPELQEVFTEDHIDQEYLLTRLTDLLEGDELQSHMTQVAKYLADEREQLGRRILVVSPETGKAIAALDEGDFYQPNMVPRESGSMVQPLVQLKPEIASFIAHNVHEEAREREVLNKLMAWIPPKVSLGQVQQRSRLATRAGRDLVAAEIHSRLPGLIAAATGIAGEFFRRFPLGAGGEGLDPLSVDVSARVRMGVQDGTTLNLHYDMIAASSAVVTAGWARGLGRVILANAAPWVQGEVSSMEGEGLFIASANTVGSIRGRTLVVDGPDGVAVWLPATHDLEAGALEVGDYQTRWRDVHDKWTLEAFLVGSLHLNWAKLRAYRITDVALHGVVVEATH